MALFLSPARILRVLLAPAMALAVLALAPIASADTTSDLAVSNPTFTGDTTVGNTVTYSFQATNYGNDAVDATVTDQLGNAEQFVSATTSQGSCTQTAPATCSLGSLAPGAVATLSVTVKFTQTGDNQHLEVISGPATNADPNPDDDRGGVEFDVTDAQNPDGLTPSAETDGWERGQAHLAVQATLSPYGSGTYWFEYGKTKSYGQKTAAKAVKGQGNVGVRAMLKRLTPNTTYHYRVVMVVGGKTYRGRDYSGRTLGKLNWGPLTLKVVKRSARSTTYKGLLGNGLADAPGACRGAFTIDIYTLAGANVMVKKAHINSNCTYQVTVPFGASQARKYGKKGSVIVQADFHGSRWVLNVRSEQIDHP